jgi:hypothetical protein
MNKPDLSFSHLAEIAPPSLTGHIAQYYGIAHFK